MTQYVMKVTGIGPTLGPQSVDDDDDQELEIAGLVNETYAPVDETEAGAEPSDEQQTREGLARLYDFLKAKQEKRTSGHLKNSRLERALGAYHKIIESDLELRGQNLKRRG
ncbi:MAG: hypothetical protein AB7N80_08485 [Bdellovibrionales bacterium]